MSGSFVERRITVHLQLGLGDFGESGSDTVTLSDYRVSAEILKVGAGGMNRAEVRIYGAPLDVVNAINTHGSPLFTGIRKNTLVIQAGDTQNGLAEIFQGTVQFAWADFDRAPDMALVIIAFGALFENAKPIPPTSFKGPTDVAVIMESLATNMGWNFENNGVSVILSNPYLPGTGWMQIGEAAQAAGINWTYDAGTLAIWPKGGKRGGSVPLYSPENGMIFYPTYTQPGIEFRAIFTPGREPQLGGEVQIQSSLNPANGKWQPYQIAYFLESRTFGGAWEIHTSCFWVPGSSGYSA